MKKYLFVFAFIFCCYISFAQSIIGTWSGELHIQGLKLPLVLHILQSGDSLSSTMDSPAQGAQGMPVNKTVFANNELQIELKSISAAYKGKLAGDSIFGTFRQMGMELPLIFKRGNNEKVTPIIELKLPVDIKAATNRIDSFLNYLVYNNRSAGAVSIFKNGKEMYSRYFGQANLPLQVSTKETFQIGSVTKTMTAAIILQLVEEKKLSLNDKLSKFYPQIPNADSIDIRQLLNHTSGLGDYVTRTDTAKWLTRPATEQEIINVIISQKKLFAPASRQQYSNTGYWLLTGIIKKITGKSYTQNLRSRILKPLGMMNTYTAEDHPKNVFPSYEYPAAWNEVKDFYFKNVTGVGDVASTPTDMNKFISGLFNGKITNNNSLKEMTPNKDKLGLGVFAIPFYNLKFYGHSGGTYGTNTLLIYNPADSISFMYVSNTSRMPFQTLSNGVLSSFYNAPFDYPVFSKTITPATGDIKKITGTYQLLRPPLQILVFARGKGLYAQVKGQVEIPLECYAQNKFEYPPVGVKIEFKPKLSKMMFSQNGMEMELTRTVN